jgi:hypothetical protein
MDDAERHKRLEGLLAIDERITALEASRTDKKPWWRNSALIAAYAGLLALVPASVTGVAGWFEKQQAVELEASKQAHERTLAYLGLAIDPDATEASRLQVLRFLAKIDDVEVAAWAAEELGLVQTRIAALVDEKQMAVADIAATDEKVKDAQKQAAELAAQAQNDPKLAKAAAAKSAEADHLVAEVRRKRDHVDAISTRIGDAPLQIIQLREAGRSGITEAVAMKPDPTMTPGTLVPRNRE